MGTLKMGSMGKVDVRHQKASWSASIAFSELDVVLFLGMIACNVLFCRINMTIDGRITLKTWSFHSERLSKR